MSFGWTIKEPSGVLVDKKEHLRVVFMEKGLNRHINCSCYDSSKIWKIEINNTEYTIEPKDVYEFQVPFTKRVLAKINVFKKGQRFFITFLKSGQSMPISFSEIKRGAKTPSARILALAVRSDALKKGLSSLFKKPLALPRLKTILMIVIVAGVIGVFVYLLSTGAIHI